MKWMEFIEYDWMCVWIEQEQIDSVCRSKDDGML